MFLAILLALAAPVPAPAPDLSVMSFNIRYGTARDGLNVWPLRRELVAETITRFDPDLLGLQEALEFQVEFLREKLPGYSVYSVPREPRGGESCAIFYRTADFEKVSEGTFWLSESPEKPGSKSWDSSLPRIASWVTLHHIPTGRTLLFANTHFDHRGAEARKESAALIRSRLNDIAKDNPIILTGDFNTPESSDPHKALTVGENALVDTFDTFHPDPDPKKLATFNGFRPEPVGRRIDWILCSPTFKIISAEIDRHTKGGRLPSDHFPVTTTLTFEEPSP